MNDTFEIREQIQTAISEMTDMSPKDWKIDGATAAEDHGFYVEQLAEQFDMTVEETSEIYADVWEEYAPYYAEQFANDDDDGDDDEGEKGNTVYRKSVEFGSKVYTALVERRYGGKQFKTYLLVKVNEIANYADGWSDEYESYSEAVDGADEMLVDYLTEDGVENAEALVKDDDEIETCED